MSKLLPEDAIRVQNFLISKNSKSEVKLLHESTATAQEAADALGVELYQIGKSIVLGNDDKTIVAVISGNQKVDTNRLSEELDIPNLKALKANEVKTKTNFVIGGVSPFALPSEIIIVIDSHLYGLTKCFVAAGHPKAIVETFGKEIVTLTNSKILSIIVR